ncbi:hypothetical protein AMELA_G00055520 [Ameiurus melas]|uniref:Uncharacterized protein n=1 Tax=Ameiurus melas TaxID=219545 RepID=A0A7J6BAA3_AMEME|nr:hypothetical protein AMELA_G00055520 [Ameiurus melas]
MMETRSCKVSDNPGKLEEHVDDVNTSPAQRRMSRVYPALCPMLPGIGSWFPVTLKRISEENVTSYSYADNPEKWITQWFYTIQFSPRTPSHSHRREAVSLLAMWEEF